MSAIEFPFKPRREDPTGFLTVQENLEFLAAFFDKGRETGDVPTWDDVNQRYVAAAGVAVPVVGTSFPTAPDNLQEAIILDSLTAPTYVWRFIYLSTISDAYKWLFTGGSWFNNFIATEENMASSGTWQNLTTDGPKFTAPWAGYYEIISHANGVNSAGATQGAQLGIALGNTTPTIENSGNFFSGCRTTHACSGTILAAINDVIKQRYRTTSTTSFGWDFRQLFVRPIRVSG